MKFVLGSADGQRVGFVISSYRTFYQGNALRANCAYIDGNDRAIDRFTCDITGEAFSSFYPQFDLDSKLYEKVAQIKGLTGSVEGEG